MAFKVRNLKDLLVHLAIMAVLFFLLLILFFYVYLPYSTNHGETLTLPDLKGMHYEELDNFLEARDLRFEVRTDSQFSETDPPLTVLNQDPKPGKKVKKNRKVYVTLNAANPPLVKMPNLIDGTLKNAQMVLESYRLKMGDIIYEPDLAENAVLRQLYQGEPVDEGSMIPIESEIDLVVGDGLGKSTFEAPELVGLPIDEAKVLVLGLGLKIGSLLNQDVEDEDHGMVMRQNPPIGSKIRVGELVDLWVGNLNEIDSLNNEGDSPDLSGL